MDFWYFFCLIFGTAFGFLICKFFFPRIVEKEHIVTKEVTKEVPVEKKVTVEKYPDDYAEYLKWKKESQEAVTKKKEETTKKKTTKSKTTQSK